MYCFNETTIVIVIIFLILMIIVILLLAMRQPYVITSQLVEPEIKRNEHMSQLEILPIKTESAISLPILNPPDIIRQYDYKRTYDPLEEPARRISRQEIYPSYLKNIIDLPSRGYPDNFTQVGLLIRQGDNDYNEANKIIRLFGRQKYPGSNQYEYYTAINNGFDQIKIPINNRRRNELYEDDNVYIKELDENYRVNLYKYDAPKYYPDIIY